MNFNRNFAPRWKTPQGWRIVPLTDGDDWFCIILYNKNKAL